MSELKVYEFDDYDTIATTLSLEETIKWYEEEFGVKVDREEIAEIDPDKAEMLYEVGGVNRRMTLTEAYKRDGKPKKPYVICSTEW